MADRIDTAGRAIAGLLGYNPGPGIYSRLERAIEGMPANVRVQELPGLLKRYKEGVPGWELRATDLDSTIAGRDVVPRDELLAAVRERSPVHTHGEVILGGTPQMQTVTAGPDWLTTTTRRPDYQHPDTGKVSRLGEGISHGEPRYRDYGQGGKDYTELLIHQPGPRLPDYGSHWDGDTPNAVAHARFGTHGDALRIDELQSDLGIHNRKAREAGPMPDYAGGDGPFDFMPPQDEAGMAAMAQKRKAIPFPLEDAWADLLIKRIALEAARKGHRAIEVASPRAIADKVGGNIDNYEHFYGKVVPGAIERLGRKMGGLAEDSVAPGAGGSHWADTAEKLNEEIHQYITAAPRQRTWFGSNESANKYRRLVDAVEAGPVLGGESTVADQAEALYRSLMRNEGLMADEAAEEMTKIMSLAERHAKAQAAFRIAHHKGVQIGAAQTQPPGRRYIMSDEMRRRLIEQGVGASLLAPLLTQGGE